MSESNHEKLSPYERAQLVYQREPCARNFTVDLELHMRYGYVFVTPEIFIMGRAVDHKAGYAAITNPAVRHVDHTAWLIYLMAGSMDRHLDRYLPYPLPYIGWERKNVLRFYAASKIWSKLKYDNVAVREIYPVLQGRRREATQTTIATSANNGG